MSNIQNNIDNCTNDVLCNFSKNKRFKLSKTKPKVVTILEKPQISKIKLSKEDINNISESALGNELLRFRKKLYRHFTSNNLKLLNSNIKTLKVKIKYIAPEILLLKFATGKYKIKKNKIEIIKYFKDECTNHEFFHMATSFYDKKLNIGFCGFEQIFFYKKEAIGYGLNEGYTDLLSNRYFNEEVDDTSYCYNVCMFFSKKLEEIVGQKEMEHFYLNADLLGLYKYLINFDEGTNIVTFIALLDYLYKKASLFNTNKCEDNYAIIQCFLAKWYIKKMEQQLNSEIIDEDTFNKNINNYINSLENKDLYIKNYIKENSQKKRIL